MAYRQFVFWVRKGQPLGKKYRVTLPACVVKIYLGVVPFGGHLNTTFVNYNKPNMLKHILLNK
jgi:hypothetical protein